MVLRLAERDPFTGPRHHPPPAAGEHHRAGGASGPGSTAPTWRCPAGSARRRDRQLRCRQIHHPAHPRRRDLRVRGRAGLGPRPRRLRPRRPRPAVSAAGNATPPESPTRSPTRSRWPKSDPGLLAELGMGAAWAPSPTRPALVVIIDEYPRLTDQAKALAVALLRVGRKSRITLILAATEATSDALGAAIADTTALRDPARLPPHRRPPRPRPAHARRRMATRPAAPRHRR